MKYYIGYRPLNSLYKELFISGFKFKNNSPSWSGYVDRLAYDLTTFGKIYLVNAFLYRFRHIIDNPKIHILEDE